MYKRLLALVLILCLIVPQVVLANSSAPIGEANSSYITDPYDSWNYGFTDFAPPTNEQIELMQPDGTSFFVRLNPMENGGYAETMDEYTVVSNDDGWWTYAIVENGTIVPSNMVVGKDAPNGIGKKLGHHKSIWLDDKGNDARDELFDGVRDVYSPNNSIYAEAAEETQTVVKRYAVLLVQYQDVKFEPYQTREWFQEQLKGFGTNETGTLEEYYYEMSYGKFRPQMDVYGPFTSSYNMEKFDYQLAGGWSVAAAINNEIGAMASEEIDWKEYSNAVSGSYRNIDMVVMIHAGPGKEATGIPGQIWSHASSASFRTGQFAEDGREYRIRASNTCPAIGFNIGVVAHEMGHSIGERDYYNTSSPQTTSGSGEWDLMASGSWVGNVPAGSNPTYMNPWSKIRQGWIEPTVIEETTYGIEISPRSIKPDLYKVPLGGSGSTEEALYIEYISTREPNALFDKAAPGSGLLIWHYDGGVSNNNRSDARMLMRVEEYDYLDGTQELGSLFWNRGEPTDPWFDTQIGMTPFTLPSTNRNAPLNGEVQTGWYVTNISAIGPTMTFDVVREEDMGKIATERPRFVAEPVIAGQGPAALTTSVHNYTAETLTTATVEFWAKSGTKEFSLGTTTVDSLAPGLTTNVSVTWEEPYAGEFSVWAKVTSASMESVYETGTVRVFARQANVLIVDDDDGYGAEEAYEGVLTALGVPYVMVTGTTTLDVLNQYELVIWHAGQAGRLNGQLTAHDREILKAYLSLGGKLWMNSPRLAAALGASSGVDRDMLRDYFGASYPMSNQNSGGYIVGTGQPIGGTGSYALRAYPGRSIQDFLVPAESQLGTVNPLFTWTQGEHLGMEVLGNEESGNFHVVYFGFCMSQLISGQDRLALTQQVLDRFGISSVYLENNTYLLQGSVGATVYIHDAGALKPVAMVYSAAMPEGRELKFTAVGNQGTFKATFNMQKTGSKGNVLLVNDLDTLAVKYIDSTGVERWAYADVKARVDVDRPAIIHHDNIFSGTDNAPLEVMAVVTDDISVKQVDLYYRVAGAAQFIKAAMKASVPGVYTVVVPATAMTQLGFEYFIVASDSKGNLTYHNAPGEPQFVAIQPRTLNAR